MSDLEPRRLALAGRIQRDRAGEDLHTVSPEPWVSSGQSANQGRVVGFRPVRGEVTARLAHEAHSARNGADGMGFDLDGRGRRVRARELRIEGARDAIGTLRRKARG